MTMKVENHATTTVIKNNVPLHELSETKPVEIKFSRVKFSATPIVHQIETLKTIPKRDRAKRWVTTEEFIIHKEECRRALDEVKNVTDGAAIFAYRGLEMIDPASIAKRQRRNTDSVSAVLLEQREQRQKGSCNPKAIKKAYKKVVTDSMREALENAYMDKKAVQEYLASTMAELDAERNSDRTGKCKKRTSFLHARNSPKRTDSLSIASHSISFSSASLSLSS